MRTSADPKTIHIRYRESPTYLAQIRKQAKSRSLSVADYMRLAVDVLEGRKTA